MLYSRVLLVIAFGLQVEVETVDKVHSNFFQRQVFFLIPEFNVVLQVIEGSVELIYRGLCKFLSDKCLALVIVLLIDPHYGFNAQKRLGVPSVILVPNCIEGY